METNLVERMVGDGIDKILSRDVHVDNFIIRGSAFHGAAINERWRVLDQPAYGFSAWY